MAIYTIHLPPIEDEARRLEHLQAVRDGFQRGAFLFGGFCLSGVGCGFRAALFFAVLSALWAV